MSTGGVAGYAAAHSRVRVMYGGLLTPQTRIALRDTADLASLVGLLKNTAYRPYLKGVEDKELEPRKIVNQIENRITDVYLTIIHSVPVSTRSLLIQLFRHFEIDNLKAVLRGLVTGSSWEQVSDILFPMGSLAVIPSQRMLEAGNVEAAVAQLVNTHYYETLTRAMKRYSEEQSLFPLEVALDLDYWRRLWNGTNQLTGQDRPQALRIIGPLLDMTNLMWAIRYRIYYHLAEEEVINYTLPFGYRIRDDDIRAVAAGADITQLVERNYPGLNNVESLLGEPERGLPKLELQIQRRLGQKFREMFTGYPFHIGVPLAFAILSELELQDLTVLIEAKAARMSAEDFSPYLLGTSAGEADVV